MKRVYESGALKRQKKKIREDQQKLQAGALLPFLVKNSTTNNNSFDADQIPSILTRDLEAPVDDVSSDLATCNDEALNCTEMPGTSCPIVVVGTEPLLCTTQQSANFIANVGVPSLSSMNELEIDEDRESVRSVMADNVEHPGSDSSTCLENAGNSHPQMSSTCSAANDADENSSCQAEFCDPFDWPDTITQNYGSV